MAVVRQLGCLVLGVTALAVFAGCSGRTTGASHITEQSNGSYSAKLKAVGSCDEGSSSTPCTAYTRWRAVGTNAWTNGPSIQVERKVSNRPWSQTARGLSPKAKYEYQACGKEFSDEQVICVGPDGTPATTQEFVAVARSAGGRETTNHAGGSESSAKGRLGATSNAPSTSDSDRDGGTSPLVPIVIALGAVGLVLGGAWWARRGPLPTSTPPRATAPGTVDTPEAEARPGPAKAEAKMVTLDEKTAAPEPSDEPVTAEGALAVGGTAVAGAAAGAAAAPRRDDEARATGEAEREALARLAESERRGETGGPAEEGRAAAKEDHVRAEEERIKAQAERRLEERRAREVELSQELERAEQRVAASQERMLHALERADARLEAVEARAADTEARVSGVERLATLEAEEIESARRLRETLDRIAEAERRASEAIERASEAIERASRPIPPVDAEEIFATPSRPPPREPTVTESPASTGGPGTTVSRG
jgi:hypothetical protein